MNITAIIDSSRNKHKTHVETNGVGQALSIAPKSTGFGSSVNGGELLVLSLATCFCNDLYREATKRNISLTSVHVECNATFGAEGEPGSNFTYKVKVESDAPKEAINELIQHTDQMAEIHNTLRKGTTITITH